MNCFVLLFTQRSYSSQGYKNFLTQNNLDGYLFQVYYSKVNYPIDWSNYLCPCQGLCPSQICCWVESPVGQMEGNPGGLLQGCIPGCGKEVVC